MKLIGFAVLGVFAAGCAASAPPPAATATTTSADVQTAPPVAAASPEAPVAPAAPVVAEPEPVPAACAGEQPFKDTKACALPGDFVKKMCAASYPDVALALFAKGTP